MVRRLDAQLEASARRFQTRRLIHALVRRDTAMVDEPVRKQSISLVIGWLAGVLAVAVCAVIAVVIPPDSAGDAPIVMVRDTGALYARVDHRLHPVFNLSSARLIARAPANPTVVSAAAIGRADRGPAVGIPGAPTQLGVPAEVSSWLACDAGTTVMITGAAAQHLDGLDASTPVLATPAGESTAVTYLLYDGKRAEVDLRDLAVARALRLDGVTAQPVSRSVLDLLPESPTIGAPPLVGLGTPGPLGYRVGQVVRLSRAGAVEYYVVLADGLQRVGEVAADIIRFTHGVGGGDVPTVEPAAIAGVDAVNALAVSSFPMQARPPVGPGAPGVCVQWRSDTSGTNTVVLTGKPTFGGEVALAQADGAGPHVDSVVVPGGRSVYLRAAGVTGDAGGGPLYVLADSGVLYGIPDEQTAGYLGLAGPPVHAPWPMLAQLPQGPELSTEAAALQRDALVVRP
ncbi:MAG: type VII secretion protein EccB [Mycobacterium sp.]